MGKRIGMISLGCAKNQVNAEQMMFLLQQAGHEILPSPEGADVVIINTCGFIDSAKSEAIDNILAMGQWKQQGLVGRILVTGCLSQRYQDEILTEMPEVDGVLGTGSYGEVVPAVEHLLRGDTVCTFGDINAAQEETERILTTPEHYAFLKIAEGCDNRCSYCVIPSLRGKYRSRTMEDCVAEAQALAENGVKELIVIAQDTSRYGMDLYGKPMLPELLRALCRIEKLHWIRIHYLYPELMTDELIDTIASEEKIVNYIDVPIQHVNDKILKRMNRRGTRAELDRLMEKLRARIDGVVIRTSLITGLPGEGEAEFEELCDWLRVHKLERVGVFPFSPEEGTAAARMEHPDEETAAHRAELIGQLQSRIMDEYNEKMVGKTLEVLCEAYDPQTERYVGRTYADSPEIDGRVLFTVQEPVRVGDFVQVRIEGVSDGDLTGREEEK